MCVCVEAVGTCLYVFIGYILFDMTLNWKRQGRIRGVGFGPESPRQPKPDFYSSSPPAKRTGRKFEIMNCLAGLE